MTADWDKYGEWLFWAPHVIRHEGLYYMFVCVGNKQGHQYKIHLLTSKDLWHWERSPANPLLTDGFDARDPNVLRSGKEWMLYYTATSKPEGGNHIVACATSQATAQSEWPRNHNLTGQQLQVREGGVAAKVRGRTTAATEKQFCEQDMRFRGKYD